MQSSPNIGKIISTLNVNAEKASGKFLQIFISRQKKTGPAITKHNVYDETG